MEKPHYEKLLTNNITKTYRQSSNNVYNSINLKAKHIAKKNLKLLTEFNVWPKNQLYNAKRS